MIANPPVVEEARALLAALSLSPDAVFATDRRNQIVFWNRSAERVLGYTESDMLSRSCDTALQGCDLSGNRYCWKDCPVVQIACRGGAVHDFVLTLEAKDKHQVEVGITVLTLALPPPERFLILHILHPTAGTEPRPETTRTEPSPPMALRAAASASSDARARKLTGREVEVLGMLAAGHATPHIATRLGISNLTARNHIQNILDKLEVHSKTEAVAFAFQKRLL
ncbi:MAG: LuxR C-terminal-related transcriptional regulator [Acidobacteriia bacterium]|nr:LuxR C-terminal-related transcriptional regulator [Terriglobia bacterium]